MVVDPVISWALSLCLAAYWCTAALSKLREPQRFMQAIAAYRLLPQSVVRPAAALLPLFELLLAIFWLLAPVRDIAALASAALLLLFAVAIAINLARGRSHIDCGCSMKRKQSISWWLVLRIAVLALLCLGPLIPVTERNLSAPDVLVTLLVTGFTCITCLLVPMIITNMNNLTRGLRL